MISPNLGKLFNPSHIPSGPGINTLLTGLQAYWKFDETTGTTAADATGNGHTATWAGTLGSQWAAAKINNGAILNGTDNELSFASISGIGNAFTLAAWCYVAGAPSGNQYVIQQNSADNNEIVIFNSHVRALTDGAAIIDSAFTVPQNTWFDVVFTFNGTTGKLYCNGSLDTSLAMNVIAAGATSYMGVYKAGPSNRYNGKFDEMGIWNIALSQANVTARYNSGAGLAFTSFH